MRRKQAGNPAKLAMVVILGLLLTACGGGDGDNEPTATSAPSVAQPTVASTEESSPVGIATPEETPSDSSDTTSPEAAGTPIATAAVVDGEATPEGAADEEAGVQGTPVAPEAANVPVDDETGNGPAATPASLEATPQAEPTDDEETDSSAELPAGDGTTGAALEPLDTEQGENAATPEAPGEFATPAVSASPVSASGTPVAAAEPPVVESCDVTDVPPFTGDTIVYVLSVDLNFRAGPGADCDLIGDGPLGEFSDVEVIGGPVIREGDESPQWVQVQVGDQTGWLAFEFLEPAE